MDKIEFIERFKEEFVMLSLLIEVKIFVHTHTNSTINVLGHNGVNFLVVFIYEDHYELIIKGNYVKPAIYANADKLLNRVSKLVSEEMKVIKV